MSITASKEQRRQLERENAKQPELLQLVPKDQWPDSKNPPISVWRSRQFLVQLYPANMPNGYYSKASYRLSIARTRLDGGRWKDGIPWEKLQSIKSECGFGGEMAVEIYPSDRDVVNVANMRHLWILWVPLDFAWKNGV